MSSETANSRQRTLSKKHEQFISEYLRCWNQTEAYKRVYPKSSDAAARAHGARLVADGNIAEAISQRLRETAMTADEVLMRLGEQARNEQAAYITRYGVDMNRLIADGKAHLIKGIKHTANGDNIEFYDAQAALIQIGKAHGMFVDKSEVNVHGDLAFTQDDAKQAAEELNGWTPPNISDAKSNG